ncbi:TatD family deoxyribonuclease [Erythrobacteraceae bacterium CFH 75059]|uniref:TatD family hydrolase n=1 Tax=Qipengyuania thermophila TaxID=2509361 RepID=UPI0010217578|nr:TatD family hydrolase [Qipengyuania thermophila]TCD05204.1 TatD family deoxyribonuclease [Erythrobacteraceae bacterium CFH 75059]
MLIDSHCHLNYPGLVEDVDAVLERARARGVGGMLNISTKHSEWDDVVGLARHHPDVWASIGVHPHAAEDHLHVDVDLLRNAASQDRVVAIGETGLDYHYSHSSPAAQQSLFRRHITVARELDLPLIIHTRDAEDDTVAMLDEAAQDGPFAALIHCFTGSIRFAEAVLERGLSISLSGIVTFRNARELQAVARLVPEERLLVETDSPFLAPVPHRGKTCEPAYVRDTLERIAALRGVDAEVLENRTSANFFNLFKKAVLA